MDEFDDKTNGTFLFGGNFSEIEEPSPPQRREEEKPASSQAVPAAEKEPAEPASNLQLGERPKEDNTQEKPSIPAKPSFSPVHEDFLINSEKNGSEAAQEDFSMVSDNQTEKDQLRQSLEQIPPAALKNLLVQLMAAHPEEAQQAEIVPPAAVPEPLPQAAAGNEPLSEPAGERKTQDEPRTVPTEKIMAMPIEPEPSDEKVIPAFSKEKNVPAAAEKNSQDSSEPIAAKIEEAPAVLDKEPSPKAADTVKQPPTPKAKPEPFYLPVPVPGTRKPPRPSCTDFCLIPPLEPRSAASSQKRLDSLFKQQQQYILETRRDVRDTLDTVKQAAGILKNLRLAHKKQEYQQVTNQAFIKQKLSDMEILLMGRKHFQQERNTEKDLIQQDLAAIKKKVFEPAVTAEELASDIYRILSESKEDAQAIFNREMSEKAAAIQQQVTALTEAIQGLSENKASLSQEDIEKIYQDASTDAMTHSLKTLDDGVKEIIKNVESQLIEHINKYSKKYLKLHQGDKYLSLATLGITAMLGLSVGLLFGIFLI